MFPTAVETRLAASLSCPPLRFRRAACRPKMLSPPYKTDKNKKEEKNTDENQKVRDYQKEQRKKNTMIPYSCAESFCLFFSACRRLGQQDSNTDHRRTAPGGSGPTDRAFLPSVDVLFHFSSPPFFPFSPVCYPLCCWLSTIVASSKDTGKSFVHHCTSLLPYLLFLDAASTTFRFCASGSLTLATSSSLWRIEVNPLNHCLLSFIVFLFTCFFLLALLPSGSWNKDTGLPTSLDRVAGAHSCLHHYLAR